MPPPTLPSLIPSTDAVQRFRALYAAHFGVDLTDEKALELATDMLLLVYIGTTPLPPDASYDSPLAHTHRLDP